MAKEKQEHVAYDYRTREWFAKNPGAQTTVTRCVECGRFYKPELGHPCLVRAHRTKAKVTIEIP